MSCQMMSPTVDELDVVGIRRRKDDKINFSILVYMYTNCNMYAGFCFCFYSSWHLYNVPIWLFFPDGSNSLTFELCLSSREFLFHLREILLTSQGYRSFLTLKFPQIDEFCFFFFFFFKNLFRQSFKEHDMKMIGLCNGFLLYTGCVFLLSILYFT